MRLLLKLLFWLFGLALSGIPLAMAIAKTPSGLSEVFAIQAYAGYEAEVLFIGLMMAAVILVEIIELLFDLEKTEKVRRLLCAAFVCAFVLMVIFYSYWYGVIVEKRHSNNALPFEELRAIIWFVVGTTVPAVGFKLVLWSRKPQW